MTTETTTTPTEWGDQIHISKHPVLYHKISILRSAATSSGKFRSVLRELTYHLGYEATSGLSTKDGIPLSVSTEDGILETTGTKISDRVALIPILRSGLGMSDGMLELVPKASVYHIGMYHLPGTAPVQYFNRLPKKCVSDVAFVLDPVIASAETILAVLSIMKKWGVPKIHVVCVLASKEGLTKIQSAHPDVHVTVGMIDEMVTAKGAIFPGLGDCGDRLFSTQPHEINSQKNNGISGDDDDDDDDDYHSLSLAAPRRAKKAKLSSNDDNGDQMAAQS